MRRYAVVVAIGVALAGLLLGGCGRPAGVDGNLTDNWPAMPEAKVPVPPAPACYQLSKEALVFRTRLPAPVDCAKEHNVETIKVAAFEGAAADATAPPEQGGDALRAAFATCSTAATAFLGDDWRAGRLDLSLVAPSETQWSGGARWFRCDLDEVGDDSVVSRTGSLEGGLSGQRPLARACIKVTKNGGDIELTGAPSCTTSHEAEFAGLYTVPDGPYQEDAAARSKALSNGCKGVVAAFAGVPNDANFQARTGWIWEDVTEARWLLGDRAARCYIYPPKPVSRSLKGAGTGGLPIQRG